MINLNKMYQCIYSADEVYFINFMRIFIAISIIFYLSPYFFLGSSNHWMIWDNLDSIFSIYKVLVNSGAIFDSNATIIEQPMGGIPRGAMPSEFDALVWLYIFFGPEGAYIVNRILMTLIGFIGMYLLLRYHVLKDDSDEVIRLGVSLCFALLPFWPFGGLSVAGMPMALYAILEIRNNNHSWWNWAIVVLYPFYSNLILSGLFFLVFVTLIWFYDIIQRKSIIPLFMALVVMSLFYLLTHYRLFIDFIFSTVYVSHRIEFGAWSQIDFKEGVKRSLNIYIEGSAHSHSLQRFWILPLCAITVFLMLSHPKSEHNKKLYWLIMFFLGGIALFHGFQEFPLVSTILAPIKEKLPIQLDRFYFLYPMFWMIAFALVLSTLRLQASSMRLIIINLIALQSAYAFVHHELITNRSEPSVGNFFAKSQFSEIQEYIGKPLNTYRVASIGMHPSVSLYNGFYSLDGYWSNYPLIYKNNFREIIADELEKDSDMKKYFDDWGSRAYLFNSQTRTNMNLYAGNNIKLNKLDFNWNAYYNLGGSYLLSAAEIDVSANPALKFEKLFKHRSSAWDVYLYRVELEKLDPKKLMSNIARN